MENNRRDFIKKSVLLTAAAVSTTAVAKSIHKVNDLLDKEELMLAGAVFTLPPLPYAYDALEPHIDKLTMEIHHDKHHKSYVDNLNKALPGGGNLEEILTNISKQPIVVRNNGGGHYNHSLFWQLMKPAGGGVPSGALGEAINKSFESFDKFQKKFNEAASTRFGSGWAWLVVDTSVLNDKMLKIGSTSNQDNPLMDISEFKGRPVLALDVWEHAYYLKNQNKRTDYINSWWNVVNWDKANELFAASGK
jgi:Fe-Mn family superoxide dismutase